PRKSVTALTPSALLQNDEYHSNLSSNEQPRVVSTAATTPISTNVSPSKENPEDFSAFSFTKKAISKTSSFASDLTTSIHKCEKSSCRSSTTSSNTTQSEPEPEIVNFDYNEQIRFPRLNNHYTYNKNKTSFSSDEDKSVIQDLNLTAVSTLQEEVHEQQGSEEYQPALFDLNQPCRRYSVPTQLNGSPDEQLLQEYTENNKIYQKQIEKDSELQSEMQTINDSQIRPRIKNRTSFPKLKDIDSHKKLKQLYQFKKPLLTPAVLRPTATNEEEETPEPPSLPSTSLYTITKPRKEDSLPACNIEPVRSHWKPDNITSNCMWCFKPFHNALVSIICDGPKRHHCRFCGLIYCSDCLTQDKVLIDEGARLIIPITSKNPSIPNYKDFKICKKCGITYNNLSKELNNVPTISSFVMIENPYLRHDPNEQDKFNFDRLSAAQKSNSDKRASVADVPNDWVWSSF
ncbi:Glutamine sensor PIB2, partial [Candida tropicalis]